jgi:hypothetical protein
MSSAEELTFVVGRRLRPIVVLLHVVRRLRLTPTSSREQESAALYHRFGRASFHWRSEA